MTYEGINQTLKHLEDALGKYNTWPAEKSLKLIAGALAMIALRLGELAETAESADVQLGEIVLQLGRIEDAERKGGEQAAKLAGLFMPTDPKENNE